MTRLNNGGLIMDTIVYDRKWKSWQYEGEYFPSKTDARLCRLADYPGVSPDLSQRVTAVIEKYSALESRALAAGELVATGHVVTARQVKDIAALDDDCIGAVNNHIVRFLHREVFWCDCADWEIKAPLVIVRYGKPQQVCKHILATILADWETWGTYLVQVP
jgi:hypothetical protein